MLSHSVFSSLLPSLNNNIIIIWCSLQIWHVSDHLGLHQFFDILVYGSKFQKICIFGKNDVKDASNEFHIEKPEGAIAVAEKVEKKKLGSLMYDFLGGKKTDSNVKVLY